MIRKKVLLSILLLGLIASTSMFVKSKVTQAFQASNQNIKFMEYKASTIENENGFQIDKYENIKSVAWINENEVLTLTHKEEFKNQKPNTTVSNEVSYCSVYNLNTKESKEFKDVDIAKFMGVSPDKKYVLYAEPMFIPEGKEWQNALDSGELLHQNVKLLNLSTGKITDLATEKINSDAQFIWVGNNKILVNYFNKWTIIDITGKVIEEASFNTNSATDSRISGVDDIKDLGTGLEGKIYYTQDEEGIEGCKLLSMDIKTKEIKNIFSNKQSLQADKKGSKIIMDNYDNNGDKNSEGKYVNRSFGAFILDESGKLLHNIKLPTGRVSANTTLTSITLGEQYILSPDGSKAVYVENLQNEENKSKPNDSIKVIDTKTGDIKEIIKASALEDKNAENDYEISQVKDENGNVKETKHYNKHYISNICWDSTGKSLSFTYNHSVKDDKIDTYVISFD